MRYESSMGIGELTYIINNTRVFKVRERTQILRSKIIFVVANTILLVSTILFLIFENFDQEIDYFIQGIAYIILTSAKTLVWLYGLAVFLHLMLLMWKKHRYEF